MAARAHRRQIKPARHGRSPGVTQSRAHAIASCVEAMAVPTTTSYSDALFIC